METILVVDDERHVCTLVWESLENTGYRVLEALDGRDALRAAEGYPEPIHLLLTDVFTPGRNGRELAEQFRALRRSPLAGQPRT